MAVFTQIENRIAQFLGYGEGTVLTSAVADVIKQYVAENLPKDQTITAVNSDIDKLVDSYSKSGSGRIIAKLIANGLKEVADAAISEAYAEGEKVADQATVPNV